MAAPVAGSFSRITDFNNCGWAFYLKSILKAYPFQSNAAMDRGNEIHKNLEGCVKDLKAKLHPEATYAIQTLEELRQYPVVHGEMEIAFDSKKKKVEWFADNAWFRVKIDGVGINGTKALIVDWKTGKIRPNLYQLRIYAVAVFTLFPKVKEVVVRYVWLDGMDHTDEKFKRTEMKEIWKEIDADMKKIQAVADARGWENEKRPSRLCDWCPVKVKHCEHAKK